MIAWGRFAVQLAFMSLPPAPRMGDGAFGPF
jgi:hypothetical protein